MINFRSRQWLKRIFPYRIHRFIRKNLYSFGVYTWVTKSYEVWLILQNLLYLIQPEKLIELGSGRSTNYLAEYALKFNKKVLSIEQNYHYCKRINNYLKLSFLPSKVVKYIPIQGDWYNEKKVKRYLDTMRNFDFLFIDGPSKYKSESRGSKKFYEIFAPALENIKLIVVDDTHRKESDDQAKFLAKKFNLTRFDISYNNTNILTFLIKNEFVREVQKLPFYLRDLLKIVN